jgi:hypothetical protein
VTGFRAIQQKAGVVLEWQKAPDDIAPPSQAEIVEVLRTTQETPSVTKAAQEKPPKPAASGPFARSRREDRTADLRLRAVESSEPTPGSQAIGHAQSKPPGLSGMIDQSVVQQESYTYTAQRVLAVPVGGKPTEIRSEPTAPITLGMRDTFPPDAPRGLLSVPGTIGPTVGAIPVHRTIDLAWEPNTEVDLAGYLVYRLDLQSGQPRNGDTLEMTKLTATPIPGSAYRDADVVPGHRYAYRITAVDRNGNESAPSAPVEDSPDGT